MRLICVLPFALHVFHVDQVLLIAIFSVVLAFGLNIAEVSASGIPKKLIA